MADEALKAKLRAGFDGLVAAAGDDPRKLCAVAETAQTIGLGERAYALASRAQLIAPADPVIARLASAVIRAGVPRWHHRMLRDRRRNSAFDAAIRNSVRPDDRVLDIGAGSGLLSMMAARAGAGHVIACETDPALAEVARDIVAMNGFADRIRVIAKPSTDLDPVSDMGGQADVVIAEIFGDTLLNEDALATFADAARRLLAPGGRTIPARGEIMIALASWSGDIRFGEVAGFDLSGFNRLVPMSVSVGVDDERLGLRSEPVVLASFDFANGPWRVPPIGIDLVTDGRRIDGIVQWIRLQLDADHVFENRPGPEAWSHWAAHFHPLDAPITPSAGTAVRADGKCSAASLQLWIAD